MFQCGLVSWPVSIEAAETTRQLMRGVGSYVLSTRDDRKESIALGLDTANNNEAVSRTLVAALGDSFSRIQRASKTSPRYALPVQSDSLLVLGQLTQGWQVIVAANMST